MSVRVIAVVAGLVSLVASTAPGGNFAVWGNDTGGIIPWSPAVDDVYREVADEHCAIFKKIAHITSVRHDYGEFIGFECVDPAKGSTIHQQSNGL